MSGDGGRGPVARAAGMLVGSALLAACAGAAAGSGVTTAPEPAVVVDAAPSPLERIGPPLRQGHPTPHRWQIVPGGVGLFFPTDPPIRVRSLRNPGAALHIPRPDSIPGSDTPRRPPPPEPRDPPDGA